jgi:hypothetical protein
MTEIVKVYRDVHGPGERRNGARYRDEILVCTRCAAFLKPGRWPYPEEGERHHMVQGGGYCDGLLLSPVAERGWRWLEGLPCPVA